MGAEQNALTLRERVLASLDLGESHFREFKSAWQGPASHKRPRDSKLVCRDIGEALVAFANADGGELLVGVEDDGRITGVPHNDEVVDRFTNAWKTHVHANTPLPAPRVARLEFNGRWVLYFSIEKGTELIHLTSDGRCLQRLDRESIPASSEQVHFERQERISREYDRTFVDGADPAALDLSAVARIGEQIARGLSVEKVLQLLDLAEYGGPGVRVRRAALLLLAENVSQWHPRCEVRILRVAGTELRTGREYNIASDKHVVGCILELLSTAWEEIRPYLVETRLGPDGRFEEQVRYPEDACREALTNAIAHRDYSIEGRAIEVYVFDDRLEVRSPGALLSTVTVAGLKSLQGLHQSRNTIIARTLRELGYMREMGEGFRRIFQLMRAHDLVEPEIVAGDQSFVVALRHKSVFSEEDQRWIEAYEHFHLERDEEKTMLLGRHGDTLSVQDIMDALDLVDTEDYRALIERLQQKGLIRGVRRDRRSARTRKSPRWLVVQPQDANKYYGELLSGVQAFYHGGPIRQGDLAKIAKGMSPDSPYIPDRLLYTFRRLQLIDSTGYPSGRLKAVLSHVRSRRVEEARSAATPEPDTDLVTGSEAIEAAESARDQAESGEEVISRPVLFVDNLPFNVVESELRKLFEQIGEVSDVTVPKNFTQPGKNRGYGFVEMATMYLAKRARSEIEGAQMRGRRLRLEWAKPR